MQGSLARPARSQGHCHRPSQACRRCGCARGQKGLRCPVGPAGGSADLLTPQRRPGPIGSGSHSLAQLRRAKGPAWGPAGGRCRCLHRPGAVRLTARMLDCVSGQAAWGQRMGRHDSAMWGLLGHGGGLGWESHLQKCAGSTCRLHEQLWGWAPTMQKQVAGWLGLQRCQLQHAQSVHLASQHVRLKASRSSPLQQQNHLQCCRSSGHALCSCESLVPMLPCAPNLNPVCASTNAHYV